MVCLMAVTMFSQATPKATVKGYFCSGCYPTSAQFNTLIDNSYNEVTSDILQGTGYPTISYVPYTVRGAGRLYTGTDNPISTNRLNYDGDYHARWLFCGGDSVLTKGGVSLSSNVFFWDNGNQYYRPFSSNAAGVWSTEVANPTSYTRINWNGDLWSTRMFPLSLLFNTTTSIGYINLVNTLDTGIYLSNTTGRGIHIANTSTGYGINTLNTSTGYGGNMTNSSTGRGYNVTNSSTGQGLYVTNSSTGQGIFIDNTAANSGIFSQNTSTGRAAYFYNTGAGIALSLFNNNAGGKALNFANSNGNALDMTCSASSVYGIKISSSGTSNTPFYINNTGGAGVKIVNVNKGAGTTSIMYIKDDSTVINNTTRIGTLTDYAEIINGNITTYGSATTWKDLQFHAYRAGGANIPSSTVLTGNIEAYTFAVNDYFHTGPQEIPHDWVEGDSLQIHIHWANQDSITGSAKDVKWEVEWSIQNVMTGNFYSSTVSTKNITLAQNTRPKMHQISEIAMILPATVVNKNPNVTLSQMKVGAQFICRVRRITADGTAVSANPYFLQLGIHYKVNSLGSRETTTK